MFLWGLYLKIMWFQHLKRNKGARDTWSGPLTPSPKFTLQPYSFRDQHDNMDSWLSDLDSRLTVVTSEVQILAGVCWEDSKTVETALHVRLDIFIPNQHAVESRQNLTNPHFHLIKGSRANPVMIYLSYIVSHWSACWWTCCATLGGFDWLPAAQRPGQHVVKFYLQDRHSAAAYPWNCAYMRMMK